jgi:hypothetical protein
MDRRTVVSTDAPAVDDCVESGDSYGQSEAPEASPALLVGAIKFSGLTAGSMIKLTVPVVPDLYLETITLIKGGPAAEVVGTLSKGTLKRLGSADATISSELYDFVLAQARVSKLLITLEHSETRVTNIRFENIESATIAHEATNVSPPAS